MQSFKSSSSSLTDFQVNIVELLTHQFLFALHAPYALKAKSDQTLYYSRKICLDSALFFLSNSSQNQDDAYAHLRIWGGGLFRGLPLQSAFFIIEELFHQIETDATSFSKNTTLLDRRSELRKYIQEYAELAITRIRNGETNVRLHVMVSAILAHFDAAAGGFPVEESILRAIKNSLETCYEVLQVRSAESPPQLDLLELDKQIPDGKTATTVIPLQGQCHGMLGHCFCFTQ